MLLDNDRTIRFKQMTEVKPKYKELRYQWECFSKDCVMKTPKGLDCTHLHWKLFKIRCRMVK